MPVSSTRWRIFITATHSGGNTSIGEVEMASVAAGANLCTGGTPLASSVYAPDPVTYGAPKAFDGTIATRWNSDGFTLPSWLEYQFAGAVAIVEYRVKAPSDYAGAMPATWSFQYWNGSAWIEADARTGIAAWSTSESRTYGFSTDPSTNIGITQDVIEILSQPASNTLRTTHDTIELLNKPASPGVRVTYDSIELLNKPPSPIVRLSHYTIEVLTQEPFKKVKPTPPGRGNNVTTTVTFTPAPALHNGIVILVHGWVSGGGAIFSPTGCVDNQGNTYVLAVTQANAAGDNAVAIYYCQDIIATGTPFNITITFSASTYFTTVAAEVSGPITLDRTASNTGSTALATTGVTAPLTADYELITAIESPSGASQASITVESVTPPWDQEFEDLTWGSHIVGEADSRILNGVLGVPQSCSWTNATARPYAAAIATFKVPVVVVAAQEKVQFFSWMG